MSENFRRPRRRENRRSSARIISLSPQPAGAAIVERDHAVAGGLGEHPGENSPPVLATSMELRETWAVATLLLSFVVEHVLPAGKEKASHERKKCFRFSVSVR